MKEIEVTWLVNNMLTGDQQALARLITMIEQESPVTSEVMRLIQPHIGKAYSVGITGPPGSGKSTIVDRITSVIRSKGFSVGIIAVDPSSPFSGGAVLGDRVRMQQHYLDRGVFIRSMATRGSLGGLPRTTRSVKLLDAAGKDLILVETVGVGQTELDIAEAADTTVVVLVPEAGDAIQTMKAGLFEIADIFAVNKSDRAGADSLVAELESALHLSFKQSWWEVPILATQAINNVGISELYERVEAHQQTLRDTGKFSLTRQEKIKKEFVETVQQAVVERLLKLIEHDGQLKAYLDRVEMGELDPYSASRKIIADTNLLENWLGQLREKRW